MKRFVALLLTGVVGCDGDGGGDTTTTTEENGTVEETGIPVTIDTGSETIGPLALSDVSEFNIFETGIIEGTVEWSGGPSKVDVRLFHYSGVGASQDSVESPAILQVQATQDLLDNSNTWILFVANPSGSEQVTVDYTVTFTPD